MGEIRLPIPGQSSYNWTTYMTAKFRDVVSDWVRSVESGENRTWSNGELISTEHLRIAKEFLYPANSTDDPHTARMEGRALTVGRTTSEVLQEASNRLAEKEWSVDDLPKVDLDDPKYDDLRRDADALKLLSAPAERNRMLKEASQRGRRARLNEDLADGKITPEEHLRAWSMDDPDIRNAQEAARKARIDAARQVLIDEGVELLERRHPSPGVMPDNVQDEVTRRLSEMPHFDND